MKSRSFGKTIALATLLCLALPVACGSSDSNSSTSVAGQSSGGATGVAGTPATGNGGSAATSASGGSAGLVLPPGTSTAPKTIQCGGDCTSARAGLVYVDPCCSGENNAVCGIDTSYLTMTGATFKLSCEPKHQAGVANDACPSPEPSKINVMGSMASLDAFPGCCRPDGTCGVQVDTVTAAGGLIPIADLGLGCVDAAQFFPGMAAVSCSAASGGAAGADSVGGSAGAP